MLVRATGRQVDSKGLHRVEFGLSHKRNLDLQK